MITFILNNKLIQTDKPSGMSLLDFIRYESDLKGTKIGCREGDCGACTVLEGQLIEGEVHYKSIVSCLTPLGNVHAKHIVTIEGINMSHLSPVQQALVDNAGTQCGFCTPGFVMSLTGLTLVKGKTTKDTAIAAISGNICRCTGYKSIEKAAEDIAAVFANKDVNKPIEWLIHNKFLPNYFSNIPERLSEISIDENSFNSNNRIIGGGTDIMVQKPDEVYDLDLNLFFNKQELRFIRIEKDNCIIGSASTANEIMQSEVINEIIPEIKNYFRLISSEPIRNMGTIAGNIMNASPIADLSIFFIALGANVHLTDGKNKRVFPLKDIFIAYKKLNIKTTEYIEAISFPILKDGFLFSFEKVSKRTYLDIASVNSAFFVKISNETITECRISAGGVSPVPLFLNQTSEYLTGKQITNSILIKANTILQEEISPISDIRGSADYKRLLMRQLFYVHFIKHFPNKVSLKELVS